MSEPLRIAVAGAGLIGRSHIEAIGACADTRLAAIVDPDARAGPLAAGLGVTHHEALEALLSADPPDGLVLATPNRLHAAGALAAVEAGVPVLVEKPLVDDIDDGRRLLEAAERAGVPVLCGHHRRHNGLVAAARARIEAGDLGRIVSLHANSWLMKPDDYFEVPWRREPGAGPVLVNLIHDVDLARHFAGNIVGVQAMTSNAVREHAVEDTAVVTLRFSCGALGTLSVSDTIAGPWSWELTAGENPAFPRVDAPAMFVGGTHGALEIPSAAFWHPRGARSWWAPVVRESAPGGPRTDPLVNQMRNFADVIRGRAAPVVSGRDGLAAFAVVDAALRSARSGRLELPAV